MTIEPVADQEALMRYVSWAMETNLWNGREVSLDGVNDFKEAAMESIVKTLFSQSEDSYAFQRMAAGLAYLGAKEGEDEEILAELGALRADQNGVVLQAGFGKSLRKFWKRYKVEIFVGIAVAAVVAAVAVGIFCAAGAAASAAGGALIPDEDKKQKEPPKPLPLAQPQDTSAEPAESLQWPQTDLSLRKDGVLFNGQRLSYNDALQPKTIAESLYSQVPFKEELANWKQNNTPYQERSTSILPPEAATFLSEPPQVPTNLPRFNELPVYSSKNLPPVTGKLAWIGKMIDWSQSDNDLEMTPPLPQIQNAETHLFRTPGERQKDICILGSNGIGTHLNDSIHHAEYIGQFAQGTSIQWLHNHSNIILLDALEYLLMNVQGCCPKTKQLYRDSFLAFHEENKDNSAAKMFLILHSQACMQAKSAIEELPREIQQRLIVVTIGASAIIPKKMCYQSFNYASKLDEVHLAEILGKSMHDLNRSKEALEDYAELIFLEPHPGATGLDHDCESPTFTTKIIGHIEGYLNGVF